jgi:excisionase family DNA binding protein
MRTGAETMKTAVAELIGLEELGARLKLHPETVRGLYRRGTIPGLRIGHRTLRFDYEAVLEALRAANDPAAETATR